MWNTMDSAPTDSTTVLLFYKSLGVVYGFYDNVGTGDWWITQVRKTDTLPWTQWYLENGEEPVAWCPVQEFTS